MLFYYTISYESCCSHLLKALVFWYNCNNAHNALISGTMRGMRERTPAGMLVYCLHSSFAQWLYASLPALLVAPPARHRM